VEDTTTGEWRSIKPHDCRYCNPDRSALILEAENLARVSADASAATSPEDLKKKQMRRALALASEASPSNRAYRLVPERAVERIYYKAKGHAASELHGCGSSMSSINKLLSMPEFCSLGISRCRDHRKGHHIEMLFMHQAIPGFLKGGAGDNVAVDATFCCEDKWQLLVVWASHPDAPTKQVPAFLCLMDRKVEEGYLRAFQMIREACPLFCPKAFTCDFETAMVRSFQAVFDGAEFQGCIWHLLKNCFAKMGELQLPPATKSTLSRCWFVSIIMLCAVCGVDRGQCVGVLVSWCLCVALVVCSALVCSCRGACVCACACVGR
jgi:hypothetical protein